MKHPQIHAKPRAFHWCRRQNGFSDLPIWRVVAGRTHMPLYQVLAFANRLEELGNAAANYGDNRGSVARFSADEFGMALGMSSDDAAYLFSVLSQADIGWIAYGHIADFFDRNPDRIDDTAADRQRRKRLRDKVMVKLGQAALQQRISVGDRSELEGTLADMSEDELRSQLDRLTSALAPRLSTTLPVTRDSRVTSDLQKSSEISSSPSHVTGLSRVTHAREEKIITTGDVDNSGDSVRGMAEGLAAELVGEALVEAETQWIDESGVKLLVTMLNVRPQQAVLYVERWRRDLNDDAALAGFIRAADKAGHIGERFHGIITDQIKRHIFTRDHGAGLPLGPAVVSSQMPAASPELAASIERLRRKHG